jgi:hypothetical protein
MRYETPIIIGAFAALTALIAETRAGVGTGAAADDRIAIQEKLLYAYACAYDSKDCLSWANLFTKDALLDLRQKVAGRDAILQWCIERQKDVVGSIKTRHNMSNIVLINSLRRPHRLGPTSFSLGRNLAM